MFFIFSYRAPGFVRCSKESVERFRHSSQASTSVTIGNVATKWHTLSGSIRSMALDQCTPLDYSAFQSQESTVGMSQQQTVPDQEQQPQEADTFKMEDILEETAKILVSFLVILSLGGLLHVEHRS